MKIKVAVIIKHPFRDYDWRVDIIEVDEDVSNQDIAEKIQSEMLGPFNVFAISRRICFNRHIDIEAKQ